VALYLDTAYVAECYLNEPDADLVRDLVRGQRGLTSSAWCRVELACVFRRHVREGALTSRQSRRLHDLFLQDVQAGSWSLVPVTDLLLATVEARVRALRRRDVFLRAGDAVHLVTASVAGFREVWTSDRHMLDACGYFGLRGRRC
jgi:predicted nucleic acid-binding protein